jgi:putative membrane protein
MGVPTDVEFPKMMKDTALLMAFTLVCVGPATVVAMTSTPTPSVRTYAMRAEHVISVAQADDQNRTGAPVLQDPSKTDDPAIEAVTTDMYVTQAAVADLFEVEASKLALQKTDNANVKSFAQMMIDDHSSALERLKTATSASSTPATVPDKLDQKHQGQLDELARTISGPAFDRAYIDVQLSGHDDTLKLHRSYAAQGDSPALKQHASSTVPIVTAHIEEAQRLSSSVKGM